MSISVEGDRAIVSAIENVERAINELLQGTQELDRRDHRLMVTLRDKYSLPQRMSNVAQGVSDLLAAFKLHGR